MNHESDCVIVGAGYAGLTAAYRLKQRGLAYRILEQRDRIGGLSRTESVDGVSFDIGPHILFMRDREALSFWQSLMDDELIVQPRRSKLYSQGKLIRSPLDPIDAILKLGVPEITRMLMSFLHRRIVPVRDDDSCRAWVINNFGDRLYDRFYRSYNEKLWGVPTGEISSSWAGTRIRFTLLSVLRDALVRKERHTVKHFAYPPGGSQTLLDRLLQEVLAPEEHRYLHVGQQVTEIEVDGDQFRVVVGGNGQAHVYRTPRLVSSMPVDRLVQCLRPVPPAEVRQAASALRYRSLAVVYIMADRRISDRFDCHWIDNHEDSPKMMRVTNFGKFDRTMRSSTHTGLAVEYCYDSGDDFDRIPDDDKCELARREVSQLGFDRSLLGRAFVKRYPHAYPVCYLGHERHRSVLRDYLMRFNRLACIGRYGLHKFNNIHHSFHTALRGAESVVTGKPDPDAWDIPASVDLYGS